MTKFGTTFCAHCTRNQDAAKRPAYYLPMDVVPFEPADQSMYQIHLAPEIEGDNPHFSGTVLINIDVLNSVSQFPINSVDLNLNYVFVVDGKGVVRRPTLREDQENQRVWLCFDEALATGKGMITIFYEGKFNEQLEGFYLSNEISGTGEKSVVACTQSEPADFRRWVPSFDQPGPTVYKATVSMSVEVAQDLVARSNGRITSEQILPNGKKIVHFATTNKLPTYVIALGVGRLESSDPIVVSEVEVRVWAAPGKKAMMDFALEVVRRGLPLLEEFHGQKYPNTKLDLMALREFAAGAMENDGMFTFREAYVLIDKSKATVLQKIMVAIIVLHELDHTWDGNRHTMLDWSQLSLNEARATFMSYLIADMIYPELHIWTNFAQSRASAMQIDGLASTRAIVSPIERLDQCQSVFDLITYHKGAAVLRQLQMFLDTLSGDGFKKGMQHFNKNPLYDWGNASTQQLWQAIGEATNVDVPAFMDTWTLQPGFPAVTVARASASTIQAKQSRFRYVKGVAHEEGDQSWRELFHTQDQMWQIPLFIRSYAGGKVTDHLVHLDNHDQSKIFDLGGEFDWVVVNAGGHGF